jgi:hypothetical protein
LKKNEKKMKNKKEKVGKKRERRKALWITVVIHSVLCGGNSEFPT